MAAVIAAGVTSFPLTFVIGFLGNRINLSIAVVVCLTVLTVAGAAAAYSIRRVVSGAGDVVLDRICEVLILPANSDRTERLTVDWSLIAYVKVEQCNRATDWSLGFRGMTVGQAPGHTFLYYAPVIVVSNESGGVSLEERVWSLMFEPEANRLADWLRREIGIEPSDSSLRPN